LPFKYGIFSTEFPVRYFLNCLKPNFYIYIYKVLNIQKLFHFFARTCEQSLELDLLLKVQKLFYSFFYSYKFLGKSNGILCCLECYKKEEFFPSILFYIKFFELTKWKKNSTHLYFKLSAIVQKRCKVIINSKSCLSCCEQFLIYLW
jgi:hypothetical protein